MEDTSPSGTGRKLLEPGDMFGDYTVERQLGKGGMGAVYLVRAPGGERYAVKVMFPDMVKKSPDYRKRFAREAEFAMKIRHKNLISVYDVGEDPETGLCYIIMDYVPGGSVADRLEKNGPFSMAEAVSIAAQVALGLEVAHRHGVIHRDIKPDNIMFDADGTPKLADLGVAKFTDEAHKTTVTTTGMIIGTPAYMAPEQMLNSHNVDSRADIYSLGIVLYEMLTGKSPNGSSTAIELVTKALKGEPLPDVRTMRPEVSAAIAYALSLLCAPRPELRPQTARAAADLIGKAVQGTLVLPKKVPRAVAAEDVVRRKTLMTFVLVGAGVLALLIVVAAGWIKAFSTTPAAEEALPREGLSHPENNSVAQSNVRLLRNKRVNDVDQTIRQSKVGKHTWYYTLENGEAVIWRGRRGYNHMTPPAVEPSTDTHLVVPSKLDGHKVAKIGELAFINHRNMRSIILPEGLKELDRSCFLDCISLRAVKMPSTLERVHARAFISCKALQEVDIGDCPDISGGAFSGCPGLKRILVSKTNTAYVEVGGAIYTRNMEKLVFFPRTAVVATIPRTVKEIGNCAFDSSTNLIHVAIHKNVVKIGNDAFAGCEKLVSFSVGNGVREIGSSVFANCFNLRIVTFPASLEKVGVAIFAYCENLERVSFDGDAPRMVTSGSSVLGRTPYDLVIAVKRGSRGWKRPGSTELPEVWPVEGFADSRPIRYADTLKPIKLLKPRKKERTLL